MERSQAKNPGRCPGVKLLQDKHLQWCYFDVVDFVVHRSGRVGDCETAVGHANGLRAFFPAAGVAVRGCRVDVDFCGAGDGGRCDLDVVDLVVDRAGGVGDGQLAVADGDGLGSLDETVGAGGRAVHHEHAFDVDLVDAVKVARVAGD